MNEWIYVEGKVFVDGCELEASSHQAPWVPGGPALEGVEEMNSRLGSEETPKPGSPCGHGKRRMVGPGPDPALDRLALWHSRPCWSHLQS